MMLSTPHIDGILQYTIYVQPKLLTETKIMSLS